jgi:triacylglycerol lipase
MRLARLLAGASLPVLAACGSITDPTTPVADVTVADAIAAARKPPKPPPPPPSTTKPIIVFVHGWNSSASTWNTMVGRFRTEGWTDAQLHAFSYNPSQSNATTAGIISAKVDSIRAANVGVPIALVTHSMGSLSARYYLKNLGGANKVGTMASLAGADHGTNTALFCFQTACMEMWPNSLFLTSLNAGDETPDPVRFATWRSPCDEVINPRSSTILAGATNTETSCMTHSALKESSTVYAQVRDWVTQPVTVLALAAN